MIELACITDGGFIRHTAAMLHSALSCTPAPCSVSLLHQDELHPDDREKLARLAQPFGASLRFVHVAAEQAGSFADGYFPRSVWFRVLLPDLLPHLDRVLYLDSDLIVTADLRPLWTADLGDHLLGAVTNPFYPFMPPHPRMALGIENPGDYFNSGVLLMNLARMREEATSARLREYAALHPHADYPDQDALNAVCRGRWLSLHPRWNVQSTLFEMSAGELPFEPTVLAEALANPAVIHYIGPFKPWHFMCRHPRRDLYFRHARLTPWGEPAVVGRSLRHALLRPLPLAWIDRLLRFERAASRVWQRVQRRLAASGR